ncbi:hypothetical protein EYF80_027966 [Liparis tanakae]|uniref:Uncharacterized protein n=1 Tax=Liparis tanakae TaxID=230148 RepID=A0A4Z2H7R2_9TELE|nr:hypothetical protein EYF80_027966 [Liparis tanakae]
MERLEYAASLPRTQTQFLVCRALFSNDFCSRGPRPPGLPNSCTMRRVWLSSSGGSSGSRVLRVWTRGGTGCGGTEEKNRGSCLQTWKGESRLKKMEGRSLMKPPYEEGGGRSPPPPPPHDAVGSDGGREGGLPSHSLKGIGERATGFDPPAVAPAAPLPASFLGAMVMVTPLFTWPPEALLTENSVGDGVGDGETLGDWEGDGEHGEEAGVGA